ncbi:holo-ACP synthase [Alteromonas pelagimontana]|uniref:Holo-[acyl-carrier-protein] synthase n=1 Tax=Alteromonas pelagimontana TaxID=1858656 RepID=A0A6M4MDP5_9ALTE|nr:holo-ACP synthase [Alteromonas pelagimontana]QJR80266.1 holo-ACP synthase [Alteromonas pelagimontana]
MAIAGMGTDIIEIDRIAQNLARTPRLAARILTSREMQIFAEHSEPARYLAKRFAAKEAAVKALGTGIGRGISWQHIEVCNDQLGAPFLLFSGEFAVHCDKRAIVSSHLSISDEKHYAVATVILETATA